MFSALAYWPLTLIAMFRHVGLVLGSHGEFNRGCARGIASYARVNASWIFHAIDLIPAQVPLLARKSLSGVIGVLVDDVLGEAVCSLSVPVVNVAKLHSRMDLPRVDHDDVAIGRLAAQHLLDRGFRSFGFAGLPVLPYSLDRERGFVETVRAAACDVSVLRLVTQKEALRNASGWPDEDSHVGEWIARLPKPCGVMICSDWHGWKVAEVCRDLGLRVPEDIALIGVDNDEPWCSLSHPPLSSVVINSERIGYEAAALLHQLIDHADIAPPPPKEIPPINVITRRSSDTVAIEDPDVAAAARFIRDHAHEVIRVDEVLEAVPTSRRSLERRFKRIVGRTIGDEITRVHIERAKELLTRTELPMPQVAHLAGFTNSKRFSESFHRETGLSPTAFRDKYRPRT
jgi:LacI family transcriptional regulator